MEFKVGDQVRVTGKFGQEKGIRTVSAVLKTRLVLDDNTRYTLDGVYLMSGGTRGLSRTITKLEAN